MVYIGKSVERDMYYGAKIELFILAERYRKQQTKAEKILWQHLKKLRSEGFVFRRQHPIDLFIADFYCHRIKLVIEVDGEIHEKVEVKEFDEGRTGEIEKFGIKVIRFNNDQVTSDVASVLNQIQKSISELASPSLVGEGDGRG
jgi:very-short-patch-repair endonuclease